MDYFQETRDEFCSTQQQDTVDSSNSHTLVTHLLLAAIRQTGSQRKSTELIYKQCVYLWSYKKHLPQLLAGDPCAPEGHWFESTEKNKHFLCDF